MAQVFTGLPFLSLKQLHQNMQGKITEMYIGHITFSTAIKVKSSNPESQAALITYFYTVFQLKRGQSSYQSTVLFVIVHAGMAYWHVFV